MTTALEIVNAVLGPTPLEERAKFIAEEANECCNRSDGFEEKIERLAFQHLTTAVAERCAKMWRPISEYPTDPIKQGPLVLARDAEKHPMLVVLSKGHFVICPGVPMHYGEHQCGFMTADHVIEFMEIPE